jgi:hypothetical protein
VQNSDPRIIPGMASPKMACKLPDGSWGGPQCIRDVPDMSEARVMCTETICSDGSRPSGWERYARPQPEGLEGLMDEKYRIWRILALAAAAVVLFKTSDILKNWGRKRRK